MVYPSLTDAQMKKSQLFLIGFNLLNGISYLCIGNMVMLLIVNQLGLPDVVFTTWGTLANANQRAARYVRTERSLSDMSDKSDKSV